MAAKTDKSAVERTEVGTDPVASKYFRRDTFAPYTEAERAILGVVLRRRSVTQTAIAKEVDRSQQTVSRLISRLIERGALRQGERVSSGKRGQVSTSVEVVPEYAYSFGVALFLDALAVCVMDFSGRVIDLRETAMTLMTHDDVIAELRNLIADLTDKWIDDESRIFGVGVGIPGTFIRGTRRQINTPLILSEWANMDIEAVLEDDLQLPVWLENDANAAAIGESLVGVGRWAKDFVYLYVAAGLGGGVILNGEIVRRESGNAGGVAQLLPRGSYPHPNLELLLRQVNKHGLEIDSVSELIEKFDVDWPGVDEWIVKIRESLSLIVSAAAALLDPQVIVIGGRIPTSLAEKLIPQIEIYDQRRRSDSRPLPGTVIAEAGSDSGAIGAAALTLNSYFFS